MLAALPNQVTQSIQAEESLLGAVIVFPEAANFLPDWPTEVFTLVAHQHIYRACKTLIAQGNAPTLNTVTTCLAEAGLLETVGGRKKIRDLAEGGYFEAVHLKEDIEILISKYERRRMIAALQKCLTDAQSSTLPQEDLFNEIEEEILGLRRERIQGYKSGLFSNLTLAGFNRLQECSITQEDATPKTTELYDLDEAIGGFRGGKLTLMPAATNVGKTVAACSLAHLLAKHGYFIYFASYEMPQEEVWGRIVAAETGVDSKLIDTPQRLESGQWDKLFATYDKLQSLPINITCHSQGLADLVGGINQAEIDFRKAYGDKFTGIDVVFIDYLQLVAESNEPKEIDAIAKSLKKLAIAKNCHIVALAQVDAAGLDKRQDKRPGLQDMSYCKTAVNHADVVAMLYRQAYYDQDCPPEEENIMQVLIRKHRQRPLSTVRLLCDLPTCQLKSVRTGWRH